MRSKRIRRGNWFWTGAVVAAICLLLSGMAVSAMGEEKITSTVVSGESIYFYVRGIDSALPGSTVQIGTTVCSEGTMSAARVSDLEVPMRTILLVDNSLSIPEGNRGDIRTIFTSLVGQALPNEQFRVGVFADSLTFLCDYTADASVILSCIEGMEYQNQETYFSNVLYDILTQVKAEDNFYYTRIIMVSDGADDHEIGYTNAEVRTLAGESGIPVYTIGVKTRNNSAELETMFAFSRAANSEYYLLDGSISAEEIVAGLEQDQNNICICVKPDAQLLDGSNKKVLLKLQTQDGVAELTASVDMPFAAGGVPVQTPAPAEEVTETAEVTAEPQKEPEQKEDLPVIGGSTTKESEPEETEEDEDSDDESNAGMVVLAVIAGLAVILIVVIVVIIVMMVKKKKKENVPAPAAVPAYVPPAAPQEDEGEKTEFLYKQQDDEGTVGLWNVGAGAPQPKTWLVLRSLDDTSVVYKVAITGVVHIGRKDADIVINDKHVSGKHCDIILRGDLLYLKDLGSTNGTFYENVAVHDEVPVVSGGKIRIAENNFCVELVRE